MSYYTTKLIDQQSLINCLCWYQTINSSENKSALIVKVDIEITENTKTVTCTLDNGVVAVLHNYNCPSWIGRNKVWGFLTEAECEEYWDM